MMDCNWAGVVAPLGTRSAKPRETGVTMVIDKGMSPAGLRDWLAVAGPYVDVVKLGFGTSLLYSEEVLRQKVQLLRDADVWVCPGGTLLEIAWQQGCAREFIARLARLGFTALEVSDGTVTMPENARRMLLEEGHRRGLRVVTEVGKKDPRRSLPLEAMRERARRDLENGAWKVIVEARDSGRGVGIFAEDGDLREDVMKSLAQGLDPGRLLWEAPHPKQQVALLQRWGQDANLGNVRPEDVIALEASRQGLRSDTWSLSLAREPGPAPSGGASGFPRSASPAPVTGAY